MTDPTAQARKLLARLDTDMRDYQFGSPAWTEHFNDLQAAEGLMEEKAPATLAAAITAMEAAEETMKTGMVLAYGLEEADRRTIRARNAAKKALAEWGRIFGEEGK